MQASSDMVEESKQSIEVSRGRVNWFGALKGYGFIRRDGGRGDVFVHHTAIVSWNKLSEEETRPDAA
jgi:hypothetical protein